MYSVSDGIRRSGRFGRARPPGWRVGSRNARNHPWLSCLHRRGRWQWSSDHDGTFDDQAGADESTRRAADWVRGRRQISRSPTRGDAGRDTAAKVVSTAEPTCAVVRRYQVEPINLDEIVQRAEEGLLPLIPRRLASRSIRSSPALMAWSRPRAASRPGSRRKAPPLSSRAGSKKTWRR